MGFFYTTGMVINASIQRDKNAGLSDAFIVTQRERLLELKDGLLEGFQGLGLSVLRNTEERESAVGEHMGDAGSDSYDRDFALSMISRNSDAIQEVDAALKKMDLGMYGVCEMSGQPIPTERLEALPFTRFTVDCQAKIEKMLSKGGRALPVFEQDEEQLEEHMDGLTTISPALD